MIPIDFTSAEWPAPESDVSDRDLLSAIKPAATKRAFIVGRIVRDLLKEGAEYKLDALIKETQVRAARQGVDHKLVKEALFAAFVHERDDGAAVQELAEFHTFEANALADATERVRAKASTRRAPSKDDGRPEIQIGPDIMTMVDAAIDALAAADVNLFSSAYALQTVVHAEQNDDKRAPVAEGTPVLRRVSAPTILERIGRAARWTKNGVDAEPHKAVPAALLDRGTWPGIRPIVAITETPILHDDGSIHSEPGFDPMTGYLLAPNIAVDVPEHPTQADAARALLTLCEPFSEFPWSQGPGSPESYVPVAATLTMLLRPLIDGPAPGFIIDAPEIGSGKSLVTYAATAIAYGRPASPATWPGDNGEELEKVLAGYALRAAPVVLFDNVSEGHRIGGGTLDRALTSQGTIDMRVLGTNDQKSLPWRAVVLFSGNNVELLTDVTRRVLAARLDPKVEDPSKRRGFTRDPLVPWCLEHRRELVTAALTLGRAWILGGRDKCDVGVMGSFETWANTIAAMIKWAGGADVTKCVPLGEAERDPKRAAQLAIIEQLSSYLEKSGLGAITGPELLHALYPDARRPKADGPPDGWDDLRDALEQVAVCKNGVPDGSSLGKALRAMRGKRNGKLTFDSHPTRSRAGYPRWQVRNG